MAELEPIRSVEEAVATVSRPLGLTAWVEVTQAMVDQFADVTGDRQWIQVDPLRAAAGPFGACIAHGLPTLSLAGGGFFHDLIPRRRAESTTAPTGSGTRHRSGSARA